MRVITLDRIQFDHLLNLLKVEEKINRDIVYQIYKEASSTVETISETNLLTRLTAVNPTELVLYSLGEYHYITNTKNADEIDKINHNKQFIDSVATMVADKYLSLTAFRVSNTKLGNKYLPPMSSIKVYINFILNILNSYQKNDPKSTLITDLLLKSSNISNCVLDLLANGYETEAFSSWRTLHECECTLILLDKYGDKLLEKYLRHMEYAFAFKNGLETKEATDAIFDEIKAEMKKHNLKSKDMKKMIEYGWIYHIPEVIEHEEEYRLNFRDGVEKLAGLSQYASRYELSSEIIHSTPLLIYSNKNYFYYLTLLSLYESFFRLEKIFVSLFSKRVNQEQMKRYQNFRSVYFAQLVSIYNRELSIFSHIKKPKK